LLILTIALVLISAIMVIFSSLITIILLLQDTGASWDGFTPNYTFLIPLIIIGFAYSIFAGALWSSIPYVVLPHTLGTAFGLASAV
jgi:hypothetical protein